MAGLRSLARALILRAPAEAAPYITALSALGIAAEACPLTKTVWHPEGIQALRQAVATLPDQSGIFLASHAGVRAFADAVGLIADARAAAARPRPPQWHAVVAGPATLVALKQACATTPALADKLATQAIAVPTGQASIGATAAALLAARGVPHVLVPRARDGRRDILDELARLAIPFAAVACYETIAEIGEDARPRLDALAAGQIAYVIAMAPSSVAALAQAMRALAPGSPPLASLGCRWLALGETTGEALRAEGIAPTRLATAAAPSPAGIAEAVAHWA